MGHDGFRGKRSRKIVIFDLLGVLDVVIWSTDRKGEFHNDFHTLDDREKESEHNPGNSQSKMFKWNL